MDGQEGKQEGESPATGHPLRPPTTREVQLDLVGSVSGAGTSPVLPPPEGEVEVRLFAEGSWISDSRRGGWAFILEHFPSGTRKSGSGAEADTTVNRVELLAVIRGLETLKRPCRVEVITDSEYAGKGLNERLANWQAWQWRRGPHSQSVVRNLDLWQRLAELCARHQVRCALTAGQAPLPEEEACHHLAVEARTNEAGREPPGH